MKQKLLVPINRPLADFLPTLTIKAKDFATELTSHNVVEKDLKGQENISEEHVENNLAVRKILQERGVQPEQLPPSEDVAKIKRKLQSEEKNLSTKNSRPFCRHRQNGCKKFKHKFSVLVFNQNYFQTVQ